MTMRAERLPELTQILDEITPAAVAAADWHWHETPLPLQVSSYVAVPRLPDELITSARCVVGVDDAIVVCETPRDTHVWPGGRRQEGETLQQTAIREVREETGWTVTQDRLTPLGFLHFAHLAPPPDDYPFPSPDFLQVVFAAKMSAGSGDDPHGWTDTEGWELRSYLEYPTRLADVPLSLLQRPFVEAFLTTFESRTNDS